MFFNVALILQCCLLFFAPLPPHPIHVALTTVEYQPEKEQFGITFKIFHDDLESIIAEKYGVALKLGKSDENPDAGKWFQRYLDEHFTLKVNDTLSLPVVYEKDELNDLAIWLYCNVPCDVQVRKITITNTVMMDLFYDQTDLTIVKFNAIEKGVRFHRKYYSESFTVGEKS